MIIRFAAYGESLGTRFLGKKIREDIVNNLDHEEKIVFDLSGVELLSNSFADECFGKLVADFGLDYIKSKTTFININPLVSKVIKKAIIDRMNDIVMTIN